MGHDPRSGDDRAAETSAEDAHTAEAHAAVASDPIEPSIAPPAGPHVSAEATKKAGYLQLAVFALLTICALALAAYSVR